MLDPSNPLASPSPLPHGLPPLDAVADAHVLPAFEAGIAEQRAERAAIAADPDPPTLANTLEALERSGRLLRRVLAVHRLRTSSLASPAVLDQDAVIGPALAAHHDDLHLDRAIFGRVEALHDALEEVGAEAMGLDREQVRLVERTHQAFVRAGARLEASGRDRLREINHRLSVLASRFSALLLAGADAAAVHLTDPAHLAGLPAEVVAAAAAAAADRGLDGHLLRMSLFTDQPVLAWLEDRGVRRQVHEASSSRGLGGPHDTTAVVAEAVALRAERAALLGAPDHATHAVADQTAATPEAVEALLSRLAAPAAAAVRAQAEVLEALLHADGHDGPLEPWDWAFYARRAGRDGQVVDTDALAAWFPLDQVLVDGVLHAATVLYGLAFTARPDLPRHHPDVRVFEVHDEDGGAVGLFLLDPFARPTKRGGAWMGTLVDQSHLLGDRPVVTLAMNIPRPPDGAPALLTVDEVETLFHEFGHAVHGLCSDVRYPSLSGTSVPRDVVEFPSQVNELWAWDPAVLQRYARHHATGAPLDPAAVAVLRDGPPQGQAFGTAEYLAAALLDWAWHRLPPGRTVTPEEVPAFEAAALEAAGLAVRAVAPRYRTTYFAHVFGGDYDARYYAYIWAEVLVAEVVSWFEASGGLHRDAGRAFAERVLARGGTVDLVQAVEELCGHRPDVGPLLVRRGLA